MRSLQLEQIDRELRLALELSSSIRICVAPFAGVSLDPSWGVYPR
jgi:hypothetical protein